MRIVLITGLSAALGSLAHPTNPSSVHAQVLVTPRDALAAALTLAPDVVDFEPDPDTGLFPDGSVPVDEMPIGDQFAASHGIHFGIVVDGDEAADDEQPLLEQAGENPPDAFRYGYQGPLDRAAPGYEDQLGEWLLKADLKDGSRQMLITYDHPVEAAAGQIWDIDGTPALGYEQWRVEALDRDGVVLDTVDSPAGHGLDLDGRPWSFALRSAPPARIKAVRVRFIGRKSIVGLAFDRFTPSDPASPPSATPSESVTATGTVPATITAVPSAAATTRPSGTPSPSPSPTGPLSPTPTITPPQRPTVPATATASATATEPPPTLTLTRTPAATPAPSPTADPPAPDPTPSPFLAYLPLTLRERDAPRVRYADVALVLDASASMAGPKLAAARSAALDFAASLALPEDRLAVVRFDEQARTELDLSGDEAAIAAALDRITPRQGTRIDRGLEAAVEVLAGAKRAGSPNLPFVLLLTDGRQGTGLGSSRVAAARLRDAGVTVHAIGIGAGHDAQHLRALAGDPSRYHVANDPGALHAILLGLQGLRSCEPQDYWGRRCR